MDREHFATINFTRTASRDLRYESILVKVTDPNILEQLPVSVVHNCKVILNNIFFLLPVTLRKLFMVSASTLSKKMY